MYLYSRYTMSTIRDKANTIAQLWLCVIAVYTIVKEERRRRNLLEDQRLQRRLFFERGDVLDSSCKCKFIKDSLGIRWGTIHQWDKWTCNIYKVNANRFIRIIFDKIWDNNTRILYTFWWSWFITKTEAIIEVEWWFYLEF